MRQLTAVLLFNLCAILPCTLALAQQDGQTTPSEVRASEPPARKSGELGMQAPELQISQWVKGTTVTVGQGTETTGVKVIEFWATWCPPCRTSIPHLTEMQKKFADRGVTIVGITSEASDAVEPFVEKQGEKMDYTVAVDKNRQTSNAYMKAFQVRGIPHAFVVDAESRIVWHGHPMQNLDDVLEKVLAGTWNIEAAKRAARAEAMMPSYFQEVTQGDEKKAREIGRQIVEDSGDSWVVLQGLAWNIATSPKLEGKRDMDLALKAAKAAVEATDGKSPDILDTYARVLAVSGNKEKAIATQRKAIELADDAKMREYLEKQLKKLEDGTTTTQ